MDDKEKALNYYHAATTREVPDYVPATIRIPRTVRGDFPFNGTHVKPGDYPCECNHYGAVSVTATDGSLLGIKPAEFEPISWRPNARDELPPL